MREGWKEYKLGDVLEKVVGGGTPSKSKPEYWNGNIFWCSVKDMVEGKFKISKTEDKISKLGLDNSSANLIKAGNVITSTRMGLGRAFINLSDMAINQDLKALIPNEKTTTEFLLWLLLIKKEELEGLGTGSTVKGIRLETLKKIKIHLPPLPTQRKIAKILSVYDDLIENNLKRIKLLEEMAQKTYEEWFVRFKFPGHETAKFDKETGLPEGWKRVKIKDFINTSSGGTPSRKKLSEYYENGSIPWIKTGELKNFLLINSEEKITELGLKNSSAKIYPPKTVLLAMYGNTIGETTFSSIKAATNQACCAFLTDGNDFISYYIHQFLLNSKEYVLGFRMGAAQENISQQIIKNMEIIVPNDEIFKIFGTKMEQLYDLIINLLTQNQHLKEARDILLPRLMTGVINV